MDFSSEEYALRRCRVVVTTADGQVLPGELVARLPAELELLGIGADAQWLDPAGHRHLAISAHIDLRAGLM